MTRVERFKRERPGDYAGITLALAAGDDRAAIAARFRVRPGTVARIRRYEGIEPRAPGERRVS